jgi:hypothetical protein
MITRLKFYGDSRTEKNKLYVWECKEEKDVPRLLVQFMNEGITIRAAYIERDGVSSRLNIFTGISGKVFISQKPLIKVQIKLSCARIISIAETMRTGIPKYYHHSQHKYLPL